MKSWMAMASGLALMGVAATAYGQNLYEPTRSLPDQGIQVRGWGSGTIAETDEMAFEGPGSIRISSRNYFQGGVIRYTKPIDVSTAFTDKAKLLLFTLNVPGFTGNSGGPVGAPGGFGAAGGPPGSGDGRDGGGGRAGAGGGGAAGAGADLGGPPTGGGGATSDIGLRKMRVVVTTSDGKNAEAYIDLTSVVRDSRGWFSVGVPLQAINGLDGTNKQITSISLSGDSVATFYLGQLRVLADNTPVFAEPDVRELNLAFGDEVTFTASGSAGSTPVKYTWDFNSEDGIQVDAEGASVTRKFRREGTYTVTLTAVDIFGLKKPYTTTIKVVVNP